MPFCAVLLTLRLRGRCIVASFPSIDTRATIGLLMLCLHTCSIVSVGDSGKRTRSLIKVLLPAFAFALFEHSIYLRCTPCSDVHLLVAIQRLPDSDFYQSSLRCLHDPQLHWSALDIFSLAHILLLVPLLLTMPSSLGPLNYPLPPSCYAIPHHYRSTPMATQCSSGSTDSNWSNTTSASYQSQSSSQRHQNSRHTSTAQGSSMYPSHEAARSQTSSSQYRVPTSPSDKSDR